MFAAHSEADNRTYAEFRLTNVSSENSGEYKCVQDPGLTARVIVTGTCVCTCVIVATRLITVLTKYALKGTSFSQENVDVELLDTTPTCL